MGAGGSVQVAEPEELAAYRAVKEAFERLPAGSDDAAAYEQLRKVYLDTLSQSHAAADAAVAMHPLVAEALRMSDEEKEAVAQKVLEAAVEEDLRHRPAKSAGGKATDYSKSFSGTKEDTKVEKEFEAMMRGADSGATEIPAHPLLVPVPPEAYKELRRLGKWKKFLSSRGCYMYVHSLTHEIVSSKPDEYEEEVSDANATSAQDPANGLPSCHISEVPSMLETIIQEENKTPLFLDTSAERKLSSYFSYKSVYIDMSALAVGYAKTGIKTSDVMEKARQTAVGALKSGQLLILDLGATSSAHANFKQKLCKKDTIPVEIFQEGGKKLFTPNVGPRYEKMFRDEDKAGGQCLVNKEGFRFAVVSSLTPAEYEKALEESVPLGYMKAVYVRS